MAQGPCSFSKIMPDDYYKPAAMIATERLDDDDAVELERMVVQDMNFKRRLDCDERLDLALTQRILEYHDPENNPATEFKWDAFNQEIRNALINHARFALTQHRRLMPIVLTLPASEERSSIFLGIKDRLRTVWVHLKAYEQYCEEIAVFCEAVEDSFYEHNESENESEEESGSSTTITSTTVPETDEDEQMSDISLEVYKLSSQDSEYTMEEDCSPPVQLVRYVSDDTTSVHIRE